MDLFGSDFNLQPIESDRQGVCQVPPQALDLDRQEQKKPFASGGRDPAWRLDLVRVACSVAVVCTRGAKRSWGMSALGSAATCWSAAGPLIVACARCRAPCSGRPVPLQAAARHGSPPPCLLAFRHQPRRAFTKMASGGAVAFLLGRQRKEGLRPVTLGRTRAPTASLLHTACVAGGQPRTVDLCLPGLCAAPSPLPAPGRANPAMHVALQPVQFRERQTEEIMLPNVHGHVYLGLLQGLFGGGLQWLWLHLFYGNRGKIELVESLVIA